MVQHRNELFKEALNKIVENVTLTIHALEFVYNLALGMQIEQKYLDAFVHRWFSACKDMENSVKQKNIRLICKFVTELMRKDRFDCTSKLEVWFHYCSHFGSNSHVKEFKDLITNVLNKTQA